MHSCRCWRAFGIPYALLTMAVEGLQTTPGFQQNTLPCFLADKALVQEAPFAGRSLLSAGAEERKQEGRCPCKVIVLIMMSSYKGELVL